MGGDPAAADADDEASTAPADEELARAAATGEKTTGEKATGEKTTGDEMTSTEASGGVTDPALAPWLWQCDDGYFCLWEDRDYHGRRLQFSDKGCQNLTDYGFNDETSSWYNGSHRHFRIYWNVNCQGEYLQANVGARSSWVGSHWNDRASSVYGY